MSPLCIVRALRTPHSVPLTLQVILGRLPASKSPQNESPAPVAALWPVLDSNKSGGFLTRGDTAQTAAD